MKLLSWGRNSEQNVYRSKAVGEPPLMLALSVFLAIRNAVESVSDEGYAEGQTLLLFLLWRRGL